MNKIWVQLTHRELTDNFGLWITQRGIEDAVFYDYPIRVLGFDNPEDAAAFVLTYPYARIMDWSVPKES